MLTHSLAFAEGHFGTVTRYHLNPDFRGRNVCIKMEPALGGTDWACLWDANPLSESIAQLLLDAFTNGFNTYITYQDLDISGHAEISTAEIRAPHDR